MKIGEEINQKEFKNNFQKAFINLEYTYNWLKDKNKGVFKPFGITLQQYNVLRILRGAYPEVRSAGEIKKVILDKSPDLTRLMDRLVIKKLVERQLCPENRRKIEIKINEKGLKLLEKMDPVTEYSEKIMQLLSEKEANQLSDLLDKLRG